MNLKDTINVKKKILISQYMVVYCGVLSIVRRPISLTAH
jgi:hypothetical protein